MQIEPRVERLVQPMIHPFTNEHDFRFDMLLVLFRLGSPAVGGMGMFLVQLLDLKEICYSLENILPSIRSPDQTLCPEDLNLWFRTGTGTGNEDVAADGDVPAQAGRHGEGTRHVRAPRGCGMTEFRKVWRFREFSPPEERFEEGVERAELRRGEVREGDKSGGDAVVVRRVIVGVGVTMGMPPGGFGLWRSGICWICLEFGAGSREGEEGRWIRYFRGIRADVEHPFERYA
jgi:hypothetical protein